MNNALIVFGRVVVIVCFVLALMGCQLFPAAAAQLTREQIAVFGYNSTVTATTAMVKLERDTFGYAEFSYCICSPTRSSLAAHLAMDSMASINAIGVTYNDLI